MKKYITPPSLSTSFSESGKSAKHRLMNILAGKKKRSGALVTAAVLAISLYTGAMVVFAGDDSANSPNVIMTEETDIDEAVAQAILACRTYYPEAEFWAEGHIILGTDEIEGKTKIYAVTSLGGFSFLNGAFIKEFGTYAVPTLIAIGADNAVEITYPKDGSDEALNELFPQNISSELKSGRDYYSELKTQEQSQAVDYLVSNELDVNIIRDSVRTIVLETEIGEFADTDIWSWGNLPPSLDINPTALNTILGLQKEYGLEKFSICYTADHLVYTKEYLENGRHYSYYILGGVDGSYKKLKFVKSDHNYKDSKDNKVVMRAVFDIVGDEVYYNEAESLR
ncbi:MAG: hypothetical protein J1F63_03470 [Oscillospiraceae bacterium]|nr:hypothetical protein [Oscillospiraceae bacterium]